MRSFLLLQTKAFVTEILQNSAIIQINALVNKRKRITKFAFTVLWSDDRTIEVVFLWCTETVGLLNISFAALNLIMQRKRRNHTTLKITLQLPICGSMTQNLRSCRPEQYIHYFTLMSVLCTVCSTKPTSISCFFIPYSSMRPALPNSNFHKV